MLKKIYTLIIILSITASLTSCLQLSSTQNTSAKSTYILSHTPEINNYKNLLLGTINNVVKLYGDYEPDEYIYKSLKIYNGDNRATLNWNIPDVYDRFPGLEDFQMEKILYDNNYTIFIKFLSEVGLEINVEEIHALDKNLAEINVENTKEIINKFIRCKYNNTNINLTFNNKIFNVPDEKYKQIKNKKRYSYYSLE